MKRLSAISSKGVEEHTTEHRSRKATFKMNHFNPTNNNKVNLFKNTKYFNDYAEIYSEIIRVNDLVKASYQDFKDMVDFTRKASYGTLFGIGMKIPRD